MPPPLLIIGIAGGSGSGKSWLARRLCNALPRKASIVEQDWYYRDLSSLPEEVANAINFDHPDSIEFSLLLQHIESLKRGESILAPGYRFSNHQRIENAHPIDPTPILIIEGLFTLYHEKLRELFDRKLFISLDPQIRLERRLQRDVEQRGYSKEQIIQSWNEEAAPMFERFVEPSAIHADTVWNPLRDSAFENAFLADLRSLLADDEKKTH